MLEARRHRPVKGLNMQTVQTIDRPIVESWRSTEALLDLDGPIFDTCFNRKPFVIGHRLAGHPLFDLARLVELSRKIPEQDVEYNAGDIPVNQDPHLTPRTGLSVEETIRRIEHCRSWMVLKRVDRDPEYRELLEKCLGEIQVFSESHSPGMVNKQAFIFISSPGSVTPYHMDPEYNFLLQIRGTKTVHMFDGSDRAILSELALEQYLSGGHRNLTFDETLNERATTFEMAPELGLHFPVTCPHWVKNGPEVSISFSVTFQTMDSERRAIVYTTNAYLRKLGLNPAPFEQSRLRDSSKYFGFRVARRARRILLGES